MNFLINSRSDPVSLLPKTIKQSTNWNYKHPNFCTCILPYLLYCTLS